VSDVIFVVKRTNFNIYSYGNNYASLSSASKTPPGKYLLKLDDCVYPGLKLSDSGHHEYQGVITTTTAWGSLMIRIVTYRNSTDLEAVLDIEKKIDIKPIRRPGLTAGPALTSKTLQPEEVLTAAAFKEVFELNSTDVKSILELMAAIEEYNQPANRSDYDIVKDTFRVAGIENGKYTPQPGLNLTLVSLILEKGFSTATTLPTATSPNTNFIFLGNSWINLAPSISGNFLTTNPDAYIFRAFTAFSGYLQLVSSEAIYPEYIGSDASSLAITANQSYIMHFSGPPLTAFWSLTVYVDNYLVPNPLNRFSLHEESNITIAAEGRFDILIQAADVAPSANWTSNWLPGPASGGSFSVNCEFI
jgi:hypothetical protein